MRPFEIALATALLPCILFLLTPSRTWSAWPALFSLLALSLAACQLIYEGYRWQMLPAYCVSVSVLLYEGMRSLWSFQTSYLSGMAALVFAVAAIGLSTALPVFRLPQPTGPYKIGTDVRHFVDESRRDAFASHPNSPRELVVQVWYPTDPSAHGPVASYRDRRITRAKDAHFALVETHSILGAELSHRQDRYPLLLYTPSWSGLRTENTAQIEELASYGYVVVGIDHPYSSRVTAFPDGRIAYRRFVGEEDYSSQAAFEAFIKTADQQVELRARDASFVLDELGRLNAGDPQGLLTGRLDLARVGVFGFSLGGGTAAEVCRLDRRFRAGLNMDGIMAGTAAREGTAAPFFFMSSDVPVVSVGDLSGFESSRRRQIDFGRWQEAQIKRTLSDSGGYWMMLRGTRHASFSDSLYFSPLMGSGDPPSIGGIVSRYTLAFFDQHLKGIQQPLLAGRSPEPEVRFETWRTNTLGASER